MKHTHTRHDGSGVSPIIHESQGHRVYPAEIPLSHGGNSARVRTKTAVCDVYIVAGGSGGGFAFVLERLAGCQRHPAKRTVLTFSIVPRRTEKLTKS